MAINDGGQAFPMHERDDAMKGMTMRQWYKGRAMQVLVSKLSHSDTELARVCGVFADAQIAEDAKHAAGGKQ